MKQGKFQLALQTEIRLLLQLRVLALYNQGLVEKKFEHLQQF